MDTDLWNKKLQKSTDWQFLEKNLVDAYLETASVPSANLRGFIALRKNLSVMVSEISKIEVIARRTKNFSIVKNHIEKFNQSLDEVRWLIMQDILSR